MAKKSKRSTDPVADLASEVIKSYASKQKITIRLTEEQLQAILSQWDDKDPMKPAEITFYAGRRPMAQLKVAGYRYRGNTCCV